MPLGFERLNERSQRPNAFINFIKPLKTAPPEDQKIAQNFLERIAAQCYPVMKKEHISVMSLEEHEPNPEFMGRNFDAGAVIELVLKDRAGRWLSFNFVQMVMMHELAHCKQMNHSRYFWNERNRFAAHMEELWAAGYKGEGTWGRGHDLTSGQFVGDRMPDDVDIPNNLCGGTYRRGRGRKRKRGQDGTDKPKLTYAERQQKRIAKKFGVHGDGQSVGEDELVRGALEHGGRRGQGKPRVANSKRGRELRASAALARFEVAKKPEVKDEGESETESSDDEDEYADGLNIFSTLERIKDQRGRDLFKVCGGENEGDEGGQDEMNQLRRMHLGDSGPSKAKKQPSPKMEGKKGRKQVSSGLPEDSETESEPDAQLATEDTSEGACRAFSASSRGGSSTTQQKPVNAIHEGSETESEVEDDTTATKTTEHAPNSGDGASVKLKSLSNGDTDSSPALPTPAVDLQPNESATGAASNTVPCPICSLENDQSSPTCMACSNVLKPSVMRNHWRCKSEQCKGIKYINAGDVGRCGLCGSQKPAVTKEPIGVINGAVLRWD